MKTLIPGRGARGATGLLLGLALLAALASARPAAAGKNDGSIWRRSDLFANRKATQVGDIVTILINESASAGTQAATKTEETNSQKGSVDSGVGLFKFIDKFGLGMDASNTYDGKGTTSRQGNLTARMSATVTEVLPNGNLRVSGTREVIVNQEKQRLVLTGLVRPQDVRADNSVLSTYLADAKISFDGKGAVNNSQHPGLLSRLFGLIF